MKDKIIVDIDVITEYLKTGKGVLPKAYEEYEMYISSVVYTELLGSSTFKDEELEREVMDFVKKYFKVVAIDEATALAAAKILRNSSVVLATAMIAATSIQNTMPVLTNNAAQYKKIEGIEILSL